MEKLEKEKEDFIHEISDLNSELEKIKLFDNYRNVKKNANDSGQLTERIDKALAKVKSFNEREVLFKQLVTEYEDLHKFIKTFEPY